MRILKCKKCGEMFDAERCQAVKLGERSYAHATCCEKGEGELVPLPEDYDADLIALEDYINELFDYPYTPVKIRRQIKKYKEEYGYSYTGMLKALRWWYEIRGSSLEKGRNTIGILEFIYDEAKEHYHGIFMSEELNKNKEMKEPEVKQITIPSPQSHKKVKVLKMTEGEE